MRRILWIAGLASACGLPPLAPVGPTLLLSNRSLGQLVLRDRMGRLATLLAGEQRCVALRQVETGQALIVVAEGQSYQTPLFVPSTQGGWRLVVGTLPHYDVWLGLVPSDSPCNPRAKQARAEVAS